RRRGRARLAGRDGADGARAADRRVRPPRRRRRRRGEGQRRLRLAWRPVPRIYITGHRNPDTDSIASAIGYAELKSRLDSAHTYVPVRLGDLNEQTKWVLDRSGAARPDLLPHVMLRASDVMQTEFPVTGRDEPIREAGLAMARANLGLVSIV